MPSPPRKRNVKKRLIHLEEPIKFKCRRDDDYACDQNGELCEASPCPLNRFRFGFHKQVLFRFLVEENFTDAYFYFQDLVPCFNVKCSIGTPLKFRGKKNDDDDKIPPGCKLFIENDHLFKLLRQLTKTTPEDSATSEDIYETLSAEFEEALFGNMERLQRLAMSDRYKTRLKKLSAKAQMLNSSIVTGEMRIEGLDLNLDEYTEISNKNLKNLIEDEDEADEEIDGL